MNRAAVGKFFPTAALALCLLKTAECLRGLCICGVVYGIACDTVYITIYGKAPYARKKTTSKRRASQWWQLSVVNESTYFSPLPDYNSIWLLPKDPIR